MRLTIFWCPLCEMPFCLSSGLFFFLIRLLVFFLLNCRNSVNIQNPPLLVICNANNFPVGRLSFFTMSFDNLFLKRDLSILYGFHFFFLFALRNTFPSWGHKVFSKILKFHLPHLIMQSIWKYILIHSVLCILIHGGVSLSIFSSLGGL